MLTPLAFEPGVIFDARSVILSMAGLFGGALVVSIAAIMSVVTRLYVGGAGVEIGLLVILLCTVSGLGYRYARTRGWLDVGLVTLTLFGLVLHIAMLAVFQLLPDEVTQHINETVALPYLLTLTLATTVLGLLLRDVEKSEITKEALKGAAARLSAITQAIPDVLLVLDDQGQFVEVLSHDAALFANVPQLIGKRLHDVLPPAQADRITVLISDTLHSGKKHEIEFEIQTQLGLRHYEGRSQPLGIQVHGRAAIALLIRDITERKQTEDALRESELRFRTVLRNIPSVSVQGYREDGATTYWNQASEKLYGYTADEAMDNNLLDLIIPPPMHDFVRKDMRHMFATREVIPAGELQLQRKDGSLVDVFSSHALIEVPGQPPEMFCIDISRRKAAEEQAHYLAFFDALTQLPNRRLLMDRLQQAKAGNARSGMATAVMLVDIDNFQNLNNTRSHEVGDMLLQRVAQSLRDSVGAQDTVSRLGGDEFIVALSSLSSDAQEAASQARAQGELILERLREPYELLGHKHHFSASIGITLFSGSESIDEVLKQADLAMYRAKEAGRNTLRFFDPEMQLVMNSRVALETELHNGLRDQQFLLFYQPQVNSEGHTTGAEALVRWKHPIHGMVPPNEFIPLAEATGLILPLGHWIMEAALRQQGLWRHDPEFSHLNLSINVSARQFLEKDFVAQILALLQSTGADPRRIKLELTESLLLHCVDDVITTMRTLQAQGLQFSLDDFGTGYSSLSYLKRLPLSQIKIDQGFVRDMLLNPSDAAIAHSIIALAGSLGLNVIAEGVETQEHYRFLLEHGCLDFQGYLFGHPMPLEAYEQLARANAPVSNRV
jgi:diguanylate cyclase (GGDEF)-like protein/PAS domain S-box-containing protein